MDVIGERQASAALFSGKTILDTYYVRRLGGPQCQSGVEEDLLPLPGIKLFIPPALQLPA
jgi:hypothetical protein